MQILLYRTGYSRWLNRASQPASIEIDGVALEMSQRWRGKNTAYYTFVVLQSLLFQLSAPLGQLVSKCVAQKLLFINVFQ